MRVVGSSGPAVLLLPGGGEAVEGFFPGVPEALAADPGCRVILYDRPGAIGSGIPGTVADAPAALHETIAAAGAGPVVLIGQSLGGAVALLHAVQHPGDVAGLVLLDPTPLNDPALIAKTADSARTLARVAATPLGRRAVAAMLGSTASRSARRHHMDAAHRAAIAKIARTDIGELAAAVDGLEQIAESFDPASLPRVPAAVITADRRAGDPAHQAHARLAAALDAPLIMWPKAEHAVHLTHPDDVLDVCREVIRRASGRTGVAPLR